MKRYRTTFLFFMTVLLIAGCAYYNTFFNAKQNFNQGREKHKNTKSETIPSDVRKHYNNAIEKSWKLIDVYGDSSKYADDALFLIGKSHYQLEEYTKAERIFDQFLIKYLKSAFIPEVKLWLGKTYIKLEKDDEALETLNSLFKQKITKEIAAESYYYLGSLHFERANYETAIENFEKCISLDADEEVAGSAQYKIAESFYNLEQYENAIQNFDRVLDYDLPALQHYDALLEQVNAYIKIGDLAQAEATLKYMLRDTRFKEQYALIETKLGNVYEFDKEIDLARDYYQGVITEYPKTEGAALANFYLGQLYEKEYGLLDSAKVKYEQVKRVYARSEAADESEKRARILAEYLKIRNQIKKDLEDLYRLSIGDSTLIDSVVTGQDTLETVDTITDFIEDKPSDSLTITDEVKKPEQRIVEKKKAVARDPAEVENSLLKNRFALGEFFLLKYQHYDSALYAYKTFIDNHTDSLLTPKSYYALYYIQSNIKNNPDLASALKDTITEKYPESVYARRFAGKMERAEAGKDTSETHMRERYREAEQLLDQKAYRKAVSEFRRIAEQDSGSAWARKARYATAFIFENWLKDTTEAVKSYTLLANEYPDTEYGKIAVNKIKTPPAETDSLMQVQDSLNIRQQNEELQERPQDQPDTKPDMELVPEGGDLPVLPDEEPGRRRKPSNPQKEGDIK